MFVEPFAWCARHNGIPAKRRDGGQQKEIRDYCETDVANTFLVYLRYALHAGVTDRDGYNHSRILLLSHVEAMAENNAAYQLFLEAWRESSGGTFSAL